MQLMDCYNVAITIVLFLIVFVDTAYLEYILIFGKLIYFDLMSIRITSAQSIFHSIAPISLQHNPMHLCSKWELTA